MKYTKIYFLLIMFFTLSIPSFANGNATNGKKLYNQSKCLKCHQGSVTNKGKTVKNKSELIATVKKCDAQESTNWFDEDLLDVVEYLNQTYYKF